MEDQRELVFHDTVPLPEEKLPEAREKAYKQKITVLECFRFAYPNSCTPSEIYGILSDQMLLTSVRRSITDLTKEGRLIKCQWSESREGEYGKLNRTWRYNDSYISPLNRK